MSNEAATNSIQETRQSVHLGEIGQIAITVRDLARAKDFYQNTLGMTLLFDAGQMAFFQCGAIRLLVGAAENAIPSDGTILYFRVPDIQAVYASLKDQGVTFVQEPHLVSRMKSHDLWISFLKDPDGNTLALMSEIARTQATE